MHSRLINQIDAGKKRRAFKKTEDNRCLKPWTEYSLLVQATVLVFVVLFIYTAVAMNMLWQSVNVYNANMDGHINRTLNLVADQNLRTIVNQMVIHSQFQGSVQTQLIQKTS